MVKETFGKKVGAKEGRGSETSQDIRNFNETCFSAGRVEKSRWGRGRVEEKICDQLVALRIVPLGHLGRAR